MPVHVFPDNSKRWLVRTGWGMFIVGGGTILGLCIAKAAAPDADPEAGLGGACALFAIGLLLAVIHKTAVITIDTDAGVLTIVQYRAGIERWTGARCWAPRIERPLSKVTSARLVTSRGGRNNGLQTKVVIACPALGPRGDAEWDIVDGSGNDMKAKLVADLNACLEAARAAHAAANPIGLSTNAFEQLPQPQQPLLPPPSAPAPAPAAAPPPSAPGGPLLNQPYGDQSDVYIQMEGDAANPNAPPPAYSDVAVPLVAARV